MTTHLLEFNLNFPEHSPRLCSSSPPSSRLMVVTGNNQQQEQGIINTHIPKTVLNLLRSLSINNDAEIRLSRAISKVLKQRREKQRILSGEIKKILSKTTHDKEELFRLFKLFKFINKQL